MGGFLREMKRRDRYGRQYSYWVAVKSYRDKKTGKVRHKVLQTFGRLTEKEVENLRVLQQLKELGKDALVTTWKDIQVGASYEYLSTLILHKIFHQWKLDEVVKGKKPSMVDWSDIAEILTINRAICPNSDYRVSRWYPTTILPQLLNVSPSLVNPTRIYRCLDEIHLQEEEIQKHLFEMIPRLGFDTFSLILYDITSTYFEGYRCPIAKYGLSRDHRKDRPQILLALAVTKEGLPFYWDVLSGEIHDSSTVKSTVSALRDRFKVEKVCLVMDKGMVNRDNFKIIEEENKDNIFYLVTLPKTSFRKLDSFPKEILASIGERLEKETEGKEQLDKIDYRKIMDDYPYFTYHSRRAYYHLLEEKDIDCRYILCFNPEKFVEERRQRREKIEKEERVRAHITICILAYLLQVTVEHLLKKAGYNISFQEFISQLLTSRAVEIEIKRLKKREIISPQIPDEIKKLVLAVAPELSI